MDAELTSWCLPGLNGQLDLTAFFFAVAYYRRCPAACTLVIVATLANLGIAIIRDGLLVWWVPDVQFWWIQGLILRGCWFASCATYGLILLAVFIGRGKAEKQSKPTPVGGNGGRHGILPPAPAGSTAIEERKY